MPKQIPTVLECASESEKVWLDVFADRQPRSSLSKNYVQQANFVVDMPKWPLGRGKSSNLGLTSKTEFKRVSSSTPQTSLVTFFNLNSIPFD
jgi:hypothetical protein